MVMKIQFTVTVEVRCAIIRQEMVPVIILMPWPWYLYLTPWNICEVSTNYQQKWFPFQLSLLFLCKILWIKSMFLDATTLFITALKTKMIIILCMHHKNASSGTFNQIYFNIRRQSLELINCAWKNHKHTEHMITNSCPWNKRLECFF